VVSYLLILAPVPSCQQLTVSAGDKSYFVSLNTVCEVADFISVNYFGLIANSLV